MNFEETIKNLSLKPQTVLNYVELDNSSKFREQFEIAVLRENITEIKSLMDHPFYKDIYPKTLDQIKFSAKLKKTLDTHFDNHHSTFSHLSYFVYLKSPELIEKYLTYKMHNYRLKDENGDYTTAYEKRVHDSDKYDASTNFYLFLNDDLDTFNCLCKYYKNMQLHNSLKNFFDEQKNRKEISFYPQRIITELLDKENNVPLQLFGGILKPMLIHHDFNNAKRYIEQSAIKEDKKNLLAITTINEFINNDNYIGIIKAYKFFKEYTDIKIRKPLAVMVFEQSQNFGKDSTFEKILAFEDNQQELLNYAGEKNRKISIKKQEQLQKLYNLGFNFDGSIENIQEVITQQIRSINESPHKNSNIRKMVSFIKENLPSIINQEIIEVAKKKNLDAEFIIDLEMASLKQGTLDKVENKHKIL